MIVKFIDSQSFSIAGLWHFDRFLPAAFALCIGLGIASTTLAADPKESASKSAIAISENIDALVEKHLSENEQKRNKRSSDEVFCRRIYLDIIGRIPTLEETTAFLDSKKSNKRARLIDSLLDSYGHTSRQFNFWADLLRVKGRLSGGLSGVPYADFVKDSLEQNKPYDQFVRELLTASGANLKKGNGAVGYYLRDRNMPEDNMSNTVRLFLGTRLECAQCHDHPYDDWTQRQYFEMVAFTGGLGYRVDNKKYTQLRRELRQADVPEKIRPVLNRIGQSIGYGIRGKGTGLARLPENFLGDDGEDGEIIVAKEMFGGEAITDAKVPTPKKRNNKKRKPNKNAQQGSIRGSTEIDSREIYADWMTSPENPRFATVIANRLWKQALGVGLIEPVDVLDAGTEASNPELMEYLRQTMIDLDFDMKEFLRAIYLSETYQASAYNKDITDPAKFCFNGPVVRRMSAEQIWDSLLVLTVPDIDHRYDGQQKSRRYGDIYEQYEKLANADAKEIIEYATQMSGKNGKSKREMMMETRKGSANAQLKAERSRIQKQLRIATRNNDNAKRRELMQEIARITTKYRKTSQRNNLQRASELASPMPAGHFLRQFGQSDREVIDNSSVEPSAPQVLSMMNGLIETNISRDQNSVLMQSALKARTAKECISTVFLTMLNRKPTGKEIRTWRPDFDRSVATKRQTKINETFADLIWTIANSNEFIFQK